MENINMSEITIQDCIDLYDKKSIVVQINDGKIVAITKIDGENI